VPDFPSELQTALAARYELRRVLGRGGMASVSLAAAALAVASAVAE